jgi:hypothetical protein
MPVIERNRLPSNSGLEIEEKRDDELARITGGSRERVPVR